MSKYEVIIDAHIAERFVIEADNEEEADDQAWNQFLKEYPNADCITLEIILMKESE